MKKLSKFSIFLVAALVFVTSILFLWAFSGQDNNVKTKSGNEINVELGREGFSPREIHIDVGDTVEFSTKRGKPFWPASNLHPTHEIYPEFDPGRALDPGDTWLFTFTKEGEWKYHDHITANFTGKIIVGDQPKGIAKWILELFKPKGCVHISNEEKPQCWDELLEETLYKDGLDEAFDLFVELYRTDPEIPKACHGWGHVLGEAAYDLYVEGEDFELREEASYCSYGFYHGFLEKVLLATNDIYEALRFCNYIRDELSADGITYRNCAHGIGHGVTATIAEDPAFWGDFQGIADKGISACEFLFELNTKEMRECYDGVFNELSLDLYGNEYELSWDRFKALGDPLHYCRIQKERHKAPCYFEFMGILEAYYNREANFFRKGVQLILDSIKEERHAKIAMHKFAADSVQDHITESNFKNNIEVCQNAGDLKNTCLEGLLVGFFAHGDPENPHPKVFAFCESPALTSEETRTCYAASLFRLKNYYYSPKEQREICEDVPDEYKEYRVWETFSGSIKGNPCP